MLAVVNTVGRNCQLVATALVADQFSNIVVWPQHRW